MSVRLAAHPTPMASLTPRTCKWRVPRRWLRLPRRASPTLTFPSRYMSARLALVLSSCHVREAGEGGGVVGVDASGQAHERLVWVADSPNLVKQEAVLAFKPISGTSRSEASWRMTARFAGNAVLPDGPSDGGEKHRDVRLVVLARSSCQRRGTRFDLLPETIINVGLGAAAFDCQIEHSDTGVLAVDVVAQISTPAGLRVEGEHIGVVGGDGVADNDEVKAEAALQ
ncbi:hypothetical protein L7F22_033075 [Adiantum nelumboides]|nr:hypothetical protein [Adiantum nelumboides]